MIFQKVSTMIAIFATIGLVSTTNNHNSVQAFSVGTTTKASKTTTSLSLNLNNKNMIPSMGAKSLKPASTPLMDSGKAVARSGELLIDLTKALDLYGGALSAAGAQIRNSGDCLAQAAASCRFKTGLEIVIDEFREAATCLSEATDKKALLEHVRS